MYKHIHIHSAQPKKGGKEETLTEMMHLLQTLTAKVLPRRTSHTHFVARGSDGLERPSVANEG